MSTVAVLRPRVRTDLDPRPAGPGAVAPLAPRRRRSRAKPRPARPRLVVISELRGLGGLVLEQALLDRTAQPLPSLMAWTNRLAAELDVRDAGLPADYRELLFCIRAIMRRAEADPERPLVALPAAA